MSLASKFEFTNKAKRITFCGAVAVIVVALVMLPADAWMLRSSRSSRPPFSWIPLPDAVILVLFWLGGWIVALFATEEGDYRWRGIAIIAASVIMGILMFAPLV